MARYMTDVSRPPSQRIQAVLRVFWGGPGLGGVVDGWRPISTIPQGVHVRVLTVRGLVRQTRVPMHWQPTQVIRNGVLHCFASGPTTGDLAAIAWRALHDGEVATERAN